MEDEGIDNSRCPTVPSVPQLKSAHHTPARPWHQAPLLSLPWGVISRLPALPSSYTLSQVPGGKQPEDLEARIEPHSLLHSLRALDTPLNLSFCFREMETLAKQ